ncbi:hypothetical protein ACFQ0B_02465 [Nonomuraea thailandensis]
MSREALVSMAIVLAVPPVLLLPWTAGLVTDPGRILLEAGLHNPALVNPSLPRKPCSHSAQAARDCRRSGSRRAWWRRRWPHSSCADSA